MIFAHSLRYREGVGEGVDVDMRIGFSIGVGGLICSPQVRIADL